MSLIINSSGSLVFYSVDGYCVHSPKLIVSQTADCHPGLPICVIIKLQARSQKILLGSAFEEKVDLLILQYSPGAVAEFIIVWCILIAHIHEGLY